MPSKAARQDKTIKLERVTNGSTSDAVSYPINNLDMVQGWVGVE